MSETANSATAIRLDRAVIVDEPKFNGLTKPCFVETHGRYFALGAIQQSTILPYLHENNHGLISIKAIGAPTNNINPQMGTVKKP